MLKYLEFLLENKDEFRLYYSSEFRDILRSIERNGNEVADILLQSENESMYVGKFTLVDVTDKNDYVSFIQSNRIARTYKNDDPNEEGVLPLDIRLDSNKSEFWEKARTEMGIGRFTRKVFKDILQKGRKSMVINNTELEEFVNQYKATYDSVNSVDLKLVEGEEIRKWYSSENYESNKGQLGSSCMRQPEKSSFFDMYVKNPEVCKLLILMSDTDENKIKGRALIWKLDNGKYYQDRVYTNSESDKTLFENWAKTKNMNFYNEPYFGEMTVKLGNHKYDKYPYMDTFAAYNPETFELKDDEDLWPGQGYYLLHDTMGGFRGDDVVWSEYEQEYINRDDAVLTNSDEWILRENGVYIESNDTWYDRDSDYVVYSNWAEDYYLEEDCFYSGEVGYLPIDDPDIIRVKDGLDDYTYLPKDRVELYFEFKDKFYLSRNCFIDPYSNEVVDSNNNDVLDKITRELGDEDKVKKNLIKIFLSTDFDKEAILKSIETNEIFKRYIRGVYWGIPKEEKPSANDMIAILFAFIHSKDSSSIYNNLGGYGEYYKDIFYKWHQYDTRLTRQIYKFCYSFDFKEFNEYTYKAFIYFNY